MTSEKEREYREEAERLSLLSVVEQRQIVAMHEADAKNPKVPKRDRDYAAERAKALTQLLGLTRRRGKQKGKKS